MSNNYSIYFAGDLFNHKDLIGNLLLSEAIEKESSGRYICVVPQHLCQKPSKKSLPDVTFALFRSIWSKVQTVQLIFAIVI